MTRKPNGGRAWFGWSVYVLERCAAPRSIDYSREHIPGGKRSGRRETALSVQVLLLRAIPDEVDQKDLIDWYAGARMMSARSDRSRRHVRALADRFEQALRDNGFLE